MPLIQCTQKLLAELPKTQKVVQPDLPELLGSWHATLIRKWRRKSVLFTNDSTRFSFVIPDLMKLDFQSLESIFIHDLLLNLAHEGLDRYNDKIIQEYEGRLHHASYKNRSVVSSMNDISNRIRRCLTEYKSMEEVNWLDICSSINRIPFIANKSFSATELIQKKLNDSPIYFSLPAKHRGTEWLRFEIKHEG